MHCTPDVQDTHSSNSYVRSTRIPSHLLSPGLQGTKAASARCVNPCLANLLGMAWKRCCAISANACSGGGAHTLAGCIPTHQEAPITLAGCIPPKRVTLKRTHGVTAPLYRCLPD